MADEKLPGYVESVLWDHREDCHAGTGSCGGCVTLSEREEAILRFAREREAAALERAAKACDRVAGGGEMKTIGLPFTHDGRKVYDHGANYCAWEIRAMIHKEPANGS